MEELTVEEAMERYPYFKEMQSRMLFTTKQDFEKLKDSEKINVDSMDVSIEFLKRILSNDDYFEYASRYFNNELSEFKVTYIMGGDTGGSLGYKKTTIIKGFEQLIETNKIELEADEQQRYEILKNSISFDRFLEKNKNQNYDIDIEGNHYSFSVNQLVALMNLSNEEFSELCSNREIKNIGEVPKEYLIYAAFKFFVENNVLDEYLVSDSIKNNYSDIRNLKNIDLQAINKHLTTTDTKYKDVKINRDLENAIVSGMPEDATELEKAIYLYIKMCKLFTYDDEYYAVNQRGKAAEKHKSIDHVSSITLDNNKVVCFEFNLIYSKLLNDLGIKFSSDYKGMISESYGEGHANLEFRTGKFLVEADSVTSILQGDMMQSKLNQPLVGLKCININAQTKQEFKDSVTKMYELIAQQEKKADKVQRVEHIQTLNELLDEYAHVTENICEVDLNEKLEILVDKVNSTEMVGIDSLSYILQLRKILFTEEQRKNNIAISVIRNNEPLEDGKLAMASAIITINDESFEDVDFQNKYYLYNPNHLLEPISHDEVQEKFDSGVLEYVAKKDPKIPGIIENGGIKK